MDKKSTTSKTESTNKTTSAKTPSQNPSSKQNPTLNSSQKKEATKLNPVKPKGKTNEAEKKTLRQARENQPRNNTRLGGNKNTKREKKRSRKRTLFTFRETCVKLQRGRTRLRRSNFPQI